MDVQTSGFQLLATLASRRSVSPKRLAAPGPDTAAQEAMLLAALAAPDHGGLHPWRVLDFPASQRERLADLFEQEKLRRDPLASALDRERAREHALRPPMLLAFIVGVQARSAIPEREQWLAAGAALGNLLNAAHLLGFGAIVLSGDRCFDPVLKQQLGLGPSEELTGFISVGTVIRQPPTRDVPDDAQRLWGTWPGVVKASSFIS